MAATPTHKLHINRHSDVSVKEQLVTQLMIRITSGHHQPGEKLPSIRQLARQLGIHSNTCLAVYQQLETMGLVERKQGSGTQVRMLPKGQTFSQIAGNTSVAFLVNTLVQHAKEQGLNRDALLKMIDQHWPNTEAMPYIYVDRMADILPLFAHELSRHVGQPVQSVTVDELALKSSTHYNHPTHWITSSYYAHVLQEFMEQSRITGSITVVPTNSGQTIRDKITQLPNGRLVVVVSVSTVILQQAESVIKALRGDELLVCLRLNSELSPPEYNTLLNQAALVVADCLTEETCRQYAKKKVEVISVLSQNINLHTLFKTE